MEKEEGLNVQSHAHTHFSISNNIIIFKTLKTLSFFIVLRNKKMVFARMNETLIYRF